MGVIVLAAIVIASAVASAAVVVASVIATVVLAVVSGIAAIGLAIGSAIAIAVTSTVAALGTAFAAVGSVISAGVAAVMPTLSAIGSAIMTYGNIIVTAMKTFLEAIHFATILKIHNIAMLVSKDYKEMISKLYTNIGDVSEALGLGAHFMNLVLRDARNVVLDVSSLMGRSYDLSQVTWLSTMKNYLVEFEGVATTFEKDPGALLEHISEIIDTPAIEAKSGFMRNFITIVDNTVTLTDKLAGKAYQLREDLTKLIHNLPGTIGHHIWDEVGPQIEAFGKFIDVDYKETRDKIVKGLDILDDVRRKHTDQLGQITEKILNPGDLLAGIDDLGELERIRQENVVHELSTRTTVREFKEVNQALDRAQEGMSRIWDAVKTLRKPPPYHVKEIGKPIRPAFAPPVFRKTWFVGDF